MDVAVVLLGLSIVAVWVPGIPLGSGKSVPAWIPLFSAAVIAGIAVGGLSWVAASSLAILILVSWSAQHSGHIALRGLGTIVATLLAFALAMHLIPGFSNPVIVSGIRLNEDAKPMTLYANFDKGAAGLVLLAFFSNRIASVNEWRRLLALVLVAALCTSAIVMTAALGIGYVRLDPKLPTFTAAFLAINLLFVCVMEEAFFRGLLQERLMNLTGGRRYLFWLPVVASAALFGLVHAPGGSVLVGLATLGGLGYSLVYAKTRRIETAILTHFAVNAVHFLCFTYPAFSQ